MCEAFIVLYLNANLNLILILSQILNIASSPSVLSANCAIFIPKNAEHIYASCTFGILYSVETGNVEGAKFRLKLKGLKMMLGQ